jgi:hypothetical protein
MIYETTKIKEKVLYAFWNKLCQSMNGDYNIIIGLRSLKTLAVVTKDLSFIRFNLWRVENGK